MNQGRYVFAQLTSRGGMRDLISSLKAHRPKYRHSGFGTSVTERNLGKANEKKSHEIFEEFAYALTTKAGKSCYRDDFEIDVEGNVYALDPTTIDLCPSVFRWAEFRKSKGGAEPHVLYDLRTSVPSPPIFPMRACTMSTCWTSRHTRPEAPM